MSCVCCIRFEYRLCTAEGYLKYQGHIVSRVNVMVDSYGIVDQSFPKRGFVSKGKNEQSNVSIIQMSEEHALVWDNPRRAYPSMRIRAAGLQDLWQTSCGVARNDPCCFARTDLNCGAVMLPKRKLSST